MVTVSEGIERAFCAKQQETMIGQLTPNQRQASYRQAAERTGIHLPLLAALHQVQGSPELRDGETGLGISPANQITLQQVSRFDSQVQVAANTVRGLTDHLTVAGWKGKDIWNAVTGSYTEEFLDQVAQGWLAPPSDTTAARLEACNQQALTQAYQSEWQACDGVEVPADQSFLDGALLQFAEQVPVHYVHLPYQREALLAALRLWQKQDTTATAIAALVPNPSGTALDEFTLDRQLLQTLNQFPTNYAGYPHQREALLRLVQQWRQLTSRARAIASLALDTSPQLNPAIFDSALIAQVQSMLQTYRKKNEQRSALLEGFCRWQHHDNRTDAMIALGVNPKILTGETPSQTALTSAANVVDQALLDFFRRVPAIYVSTDTQREALLQLTQRWHDLTNREQTLAFLVEFLSDRSHANRRSPAAISIPQPPFPAATPAQWTCDNLQLFAPILPNGDFLWADATRGGVFLPPNQATVDTIIQMATAMQMICDRLPQPLQIICWYCPIGEELGGETSDRFALGDAIAFYSFGFTAAQLYWWLDPWWQGGLGYYAQFPYLCLVDIRHQRARWQPVSSASI